ncbi:lysophospholipid acyltransferase family protein [Algiphilus sp.]|uniref:lysophospholipid acyltransferase family protein n=1 Tax=Algiphilus sp. TaxID=1872431 RepID=UPI0025C5DCC1|nr:lysophospholipid acyltransferase family protein [Algiphilus sp.]MCK5769426.1 1-acyl-sn-glycerol-3-phosphate acyltransferase [Algiphilus sp.]
MKALGQRTAGGLFTAHCALVFGVLIFGVLSALVLTLPDLNRRRRVAGTLIRTAMWCCGAPIRVRGTLPAERPVMVVANHASYLDGLLLTAALGDHISYVVKDDAAEWPLIGRVLDRLGVVFIARTEVQMSARQTRALLKRMRAGDSLGIFPEGTFRRDPGLLPFKQGAFLLAARTGTTVVPVVIHGSRTFLGEGQRWPRWSRIRIDILAPHYVSGNAPEALAEQVRASMQANLGETDPAPASLEPAA